VESVLYGLLVAVIFVPLYNYFSRRAVAEEATPARLTPTEERR
jgi:biopolymer transport protein ExbB/TolQ